MLEFYNNYRARKFYARCLYEPRRPVSLSGVRCQFDGDGCSIVDRDCCTEIAFPNFLRMYPKPCTPKRKQFCITIWDEIPNA